MSHPASRIEPVEAIPLQRAASMKFATAARTLSEACRRQRLVTVSFRSPPALAGVDRTIRRGPAGVTIAVRLRARPFEAVLSDMIEGIIFANATTGAEASLLRSMLWSVALERPEVTVAA